MAGCVIFIKNFTKVYLSRKFGNFFYQIRNCSAILKFCEFFAKYAAVSLPIVTPHWVYLGAIWVRIAAALAASCCRRRLARVAAALAASLYAGGALPALLQPWLPRCRCM